MPEEEEKKIEDENPADFEEEEFPDDIENDEDLEEAPLDDDADEDDDDDIKLPRPSLDNSLELETGG